MLLTDEFGFWTITVERPLLAEDGKPVTDRKGNLKLDSKLRDTENVPFTYGGNTDGARAQDATIRPTSMPKCSRTSPTLGWTPRRQRSDTRSLSHATSTGMSRPGHWKRSTPTSSVGQGDHRAVARGGVMTAGWLGHPPGLVHLVRPSRSSANARAESRR